MLPLFTAESLTRSADKIIGEFFATFSSLVGAQPGWQGLSRAGYLFAKNPAKRKEWSVTLERFFGAQVPTLPPKARRRAARMFLTLSGWLILDAIESDTPVDGGLREAKTVMVGYIHQLRRLNP